MSYFNIMTSASRKNKYFVDYETLPHGDLNDLDICGEYNSSLSTKCDAAFQLLHKGIFTPESAKALDFNHDPSDGFGIRFGKNKNTVYRIIAIEDIEDNYRFTRRFYGNIHATQILFFRLLSFHNPIKELVAYISTRKVAKIPVCVQNGFIKYKNDYDSFDSALLRSKPLVSVVIPTLNRYEYLKDVLKDLECQDYREFEVIIVDQSDEYNEAFYSGWDLKLRVIRQIDKALWKARNTAVKIADGEYILLYDDDSRIAPDWITQHLKCLDYFKCDVSSGVSLSKVGAKIPEDYSFFKWSGQIDTGNVMFRKDLMALTGMFDCQFEKERMGDGEFGARVYCQGLKNISNPFAKRIHLKVSSGGLRQMGAWDAFQNKKIFAPRPIPSILYYCRKYYGDAAAVSLLAFSVPFSLLPYKYKGSNKGKLISLIIFCFTFPLVLLQVAKAWKISGKRLAEGDKIETYE
ncbi:MAG: glycosyltransferase family 2 protein [Muribaculaceae bacterium]|nr:glycosyltransferase family 2 protein [Muribaculaceae bacterium]